MGKRRPGRRVVNGHVERAAPLAVIGPESPVSLPGSSSSERGEWIPTASIGRETDDSKVQKITQAASFKCPKPSGKSSHRGAASSSRTVIPDLDVQLEGEAVPTSIRCIELVRAVLQTSKLPGSFQHFARRSLEHARNVDGSCKPRSDLWPCPPPLWRKCWTGLRSLSPRRRRRYRWLETKALCLQSVIVALNWLSLGHARSPPEYAKPGYPMSLQQQEMVERLEDLVDHYMSAEEASIAELGRAGEKLTKLSKIAFSLHDHSPDSVSVNDVCSFLKTIQTSFDSYCTPKHGTCNTDSYAPASAEDLNPDGAIPVNPEIRIQSDTCTAMPVVAERIKWKLEPSFDPTPFLTDPVAQKAFLDPDVLRRPVADWPRLPRAKVHADRQEVFRLAEKWDKLGACQLVLAEKVDPQEAVGIFAVPKDNEFDRLIMNPTVINSRCYPYASFTKTIAPGYLMCLIRIADHENLVVSSDDLCEFYYTFKVSPNRAQRNAIRMRFKGAEFQGLHCYNPNWHAQDVYICLGTMAMGDALAVEIAQQSHVNVLRQLGGCMRSDEVLQYRRPVPRGPFFELLTIDDHIGLQKVRIDGASFPRSNRDIEVFTSSNEAYKAVKLTAHPGKMRRRALHATVLGSEVDGQRGRVSAPRERIALLSFITSIVISKRLATRKLLQGLLGCWTHVLLFRRPVFCVLESVYHEGESLHADTVFQMSERCCNELLILCLLAPTIQTDLRVSVAPDLFMLDASPYGGGICRARFSSCGAEELWRHTEQRGYYTKLQSGVNAALHELGLEHQEVFGVHDDDFVATSQIFPPCLDGSPTPGLKDRTVIFDCVELFSGQGNWSRQHELAGLRVHPGIERDAAGKAYGDLDDKRTFLELARLAYAGSIREWHAGPPCWSFGTLRRPRLRSKISPAGFVIDDPVTRGQTLLAIRTAFLLTLACMAGCFVSCEQPGNSVMFLLQAFQRLLKCGCRVTKFCFCSFGSAFMKPSKWLHNKPWLDKLAGQCSCAHRNNHFTVQGTFTRDSIHLFNSRCMPDSQTVYGKIPKPGEAVSRFSAAYPVPLCQVMAAGSSAAHAAGAIPSGRDCCLDHSHRPVETADQGMLRSWFEDPEWVEDICESLEFRELYRFRFKRSGHINCLECRVYKSFLKFCSKAHPRSRVVSFLDSRVTMGAAAKGRSSSKALSRILRTTLAYVLGGCLYSGTLHCRSAWNRADGPSRDRDFPGPSRDVPKWLEDLESGSFRAFDEMVSLAQWSRPVGRWIRLLLLVAGDVERHPGPSTHHYTPRGELNLMGGFATATSTRMVRCLELFRVWCVEKAGVPFEVVCSSAEHANHALRAYGLELFREGRPRYQLVYAITAMQHSFPEFRRSLTGAWQVDLKWQFAEPGQCRAVLSAPILRAVLTVALLWNWYAFAGIVALGFGGMLHPAEFLALTRKDLVFPEDALFQQKSMYVFVKNPKTARFARRQHARIDDESLIFLARCIFGPLPLDVRLFGASPAVFRRQWNCLFDHLGIPRRQAARGATPGVLRGSGATHEYLQTSDIAQIQWKGRWSRLRTLEYYIQEVAAQLFMFELPVETRHRITMLESQLSVVLEHLFSFELKLFAQQYSGNGKQ